VRGLERALEEARHALGPSLLVTLDGALEFVGRIIIGPEVGCAEIDAKSYWEEATQGAHRLPPAFGICIFWFMWRP
jgi:hypothetical protein